MNHNKFRNGAESDSLDDEDNASTKFKAVDNGVKVVAGAHAFDLKDGPGTFFYVSKNKRYDGVWSKDMGKCGLYGTIEQQGDDGDSGLPRLTLLEPMGVLENEAYALQEKRQLEQSRVIDNPNDSSAM